MGTDKVIFVGEQWGATGSHVTGRGPVRNQKYVMRNRKFRSTPSGAFSPEVTSVGAFCITTRVVVQLPWLPVTEGHPKGWNGVGMPIRKLHNIPIVGTVHRKLATGSDVIFLRIFLSSFTWFYLV